MKKYTLCSLFFAALAFTGCKGDYDDWAAPQEAVPVNPVSVNFSASNVAAIDLATVTTDRVAVFTPSVSTDATDAVVTANYQITLNNSYTLEADGQGMVSTSELSDVVVNLFGRRPEARDLTGNIIASIKVNGEAARAISSVTVTVTPAAPVIETAYYLVGTINGWAVTNTDYPLSNGGADVYDNPVFTTRIAAPVDETGARTGVEFKIAPQSSVDSDSWDAVWGCDAATSTATEGTLVQGDGSANIVLPADDGALYYDISVNMMDATYTITAISFQPYIYVPGNHQGWSPETAQALYSPAADGVYTGYAYLDGDFKFTQARDWNAEYNSTNFPTMSEGLAQGEGTNINMGTPGFYQIVANIPEGSLTATLMESVGLCGGFNDWDTETAPTMTYVAAADCWTITTGMTAGEFKFIVNGGWDINFGGTVDDLSVNGDNLNIAEDGTYVINLYLSRTNNDNMYCTITKQ